MSYMGVKIKKPKTPVQVIPENVTKSVVHGWATWKTLKANSSDTNSVRKSRNNDWSDTKKLHQKCRIQGYNSKTVNDSKSGKKSSCMSMPLGNHEMPFRATVKSDTACVVYGDANWKSFNAYPSEIRKRHWNTKKIAKKLPLFVESLIWE